MSVSDIYYMSLALQLAQKGEFTTRPNPCVGCVLVKNNIIIGEGYHPKIGLSHAEIFALQDAITKGYDTHGATAYVTLEPCSHVGRTPPCSDALIKAGITRVVVAVSDPNPKVAGQGIARLQAAGIAVTVGVCEHQSKVLNAGFLKAMAVELPYVRLKIATSLDGRTAMVNGQSKWITGDAARDDVQRLRAKSGAIITGSGTVIADNPTLNVRLPSLDIDNITQPMIVVVDRSSKLTKSNHYQVVNYDNTLLWRDDLLSLLKTLVAKYQCYDVLVEAGATLSGAFVEQNLVDELIIYQAPCVLGDMAHPMLRLNLQQLSQQRRFELADVAKIGQDLRLIYRRL